MRVITGVIVIRLILIIIVIILPIIATICGVSAYNFYQVYCDHRKADKNSTLTRPSTSKGGAIALMVINIITCLLTFGILLVLSLQLIFGRYGKFVKVEECRSRIDQVIEKEGERSTLDLQALQAVVREREKRAKLRGRESTLRKITAGLQRDEEVEEEREQAEIERRERIRQGRGIQALERQGRGRGVGSSSLSDEDLEVIRRNQEILAQYSGQNI